MAYVAGPPHKSHREEGTGLQVFFPAHAHQLLVEVYGNHFHHDYGTHLDRDMSGNAILATALVETSCSDVQMVCHANEGCW